MLLLCSSLLCTGFPLLRRYDCTAVVPFDTEEDEGCAVCCMVLPHVETARSKKGCDGDPKQCSATDWTLAYSCVAALTATAVVVVGYMQGSTAGKDTFVPSPNLNFHLCAHCSNVGHVRPTTASEMVLADDIPTFQLPLYLYHVRLTDPAFHALQYDRSLLHVVLKGGGMLKWYTSFAEYALESSKSTEPTPLPLVTPLGQRSLMSIPFITIIGVQVTFSPQGRRSTCRFVGVSLAVLR